MADADDGIGRSTYALYFFEIRNSTEKQFSSELSKSIMGWKSQQVSQCPDCSSEGIVRTFFIEIVSAEAEKISEIAVWEVAYSE